MSEWLERSRVFDRARYEPKQVVLSSMRAIVRDLDPEVTRSR